METLVLSSLAQRHPNDVGNSLRGMAHCLIARLAHDPRYRGGDSCPVYVRWTPLGSAARDEVRVISWADEPVETLAAAEGHPSGMNRNDLTGLAAVVACALLLHAMDGVVISKVSEYGDRGDYHLESESGMVEVSGIRSGDDNKLRGRTLEKEDQVFDNSAVGYGIVSVTMFDDASGRVRSVLQHMFRPISTTMFGDTATRRRATARLR